MKLSRDQRHLLNVLTYYMRARATALRSALNIRTPLQREASEDLRNHYSSYFVSLLAALDVVLENDLLGSKQILPKLDSRFSCPGAENGRANFNYVRELRNAIVHRALDISSAAHVHNSIPLLIAPSPVRNRSGSFEYKPFCPYILGIIERSESAICSAIEETLSDLGIFELTPDHEEFMDEYRKGIQMSVAMPEWAKQMSLASMETIDLSWVNKDYMQSLRSVLKPIPLAIEGA